MFNEQLQFENVVIGSSENLHVVSINTSCYPKHIFVCVRITHAKTKQEMPAKLFDQISRNADLMKVEYLNDKFGSFDKLHIFFRSPQREHWSYKYNKLTNSYIKEENYEDHRDSFLESEDVPSSLGGWINDHI